MELIYVTKEDMLAAQKEALKEKSNTSDTPKVLYAVRHANGLFVAYRERNSAMYDVLDDLCNDYDIDFTKVPLAYTDMNSKWGWEQCWMEKYEVTPCV